MNASMCACVLVVACSAWYVNYVTNIRFTLLRYFQCQSTQILQLLPSRRFFKRDFFFSRSFARILYRWLHTLYASHPTFFPLASTLMHTHLHLRLILSYREEKKFDDNRKFFASHTQLHWWGEREARRDSGDGHNFQIIEKRTQRNNVQIESTLQEQFHTQTGSDRSGSFRIN